MLTRWNDFDRNFMMLDDLRRRMDRLYYDFEAPRAARFVEEGAARAWPRVNVFDTGTSLLLRVEVPGLTEKDVKLTLTQDVLTLSGERKPDAPKGYSVHRQERSGYQFSRSFTLPCKIDAEKTSATIKNGVLTVTLNKVAEAQPRQIAVRAQ
jgi:HSP20 family protein